MYRHLAGHLNRIVTSLFIILLLTAAGLALGAQPESQPITVGNAAQLQKLLTLGGGYASAVLWSADGNSAMVASTTGVWQHSLDAFAESPRPLVTGVSARAAATSADGKRLITLSVDGNAALWDVSSGNAIPTSDLQNVRQVTFLADGTAAALVATADGFQLVNAESGEVRAELTTSSVSSVDQLLFDPDARQLAVITYVGVEVWDVDSGEVVFTTPPSGGRFVAAFSPDGQWLAVGNTAGRVTIFDLASGEVVMEFKNHASTLYSLAFSPDMKWLASGDLDGKTVLQSVIASASGESQITPLLGHQRIVGSLAFSPDNAHLLSAASDGSLRLWNVADGTQDAVSWFYGSATYDLAFAPDGSTLASGHQDGTLRVWDSESGAQKFVVQTNRTTAYPVYDVSFSADGLQLVSSNADSLVQIWDLATGQQLESFSGVNHNVEVGLVRSAVFTADSSQVLTSLNVGLVRVWDVASGNQQGEWVLPANSGSLEFSPDRAWIAIGDASSVFTESNGSGIVILNLETGEQRLLDGLSGRVRVITFSADGGRLAAGGENGTVVVWDVLTGQKLVEVNHDAIVYSAALSPDGSLVATLDGSGLLRLWNVSTSEMLAEVFVSESGAETLAFSLDGLHIAYGGYDGAISLLGIGSS